MLRLWILFTLVTTNDWQWSLPPNFPAPPGPASNPMSAAKVELGRHLFYDKRLSANGLQSCASCHEQHLAFTDGKARAIGSTGELHPRGSMSLVNIAWAPALTWANPTLHSLEDQALIPLLGANPIELGRKGHEQQLLTTLTSDPRYQPLIAAAWPNERAFTLTHLAASLAAFERSIISFRSPYDRYRWANDLTAISPAARRGEILFHSSEKAGCFTCHGGWNFSEVRYAGGPTSPARLENNGFSPGGEKFRAPTLRNIALTAPYMHNGGIATLTGVIDHYISTGRARLTQDERADLIAFLESLTDTELLHDPRFSDPFAP